MDYYSSIVYGIIQGLTEFLPVSSSGHLAILPIAMKLDDPGVVFDLAMHVGTSLAVLLYFFGDIKILLFEFIGLFSKKYRGRRSYVMNLLLSTICTFVVVLLIKDIASKYGRALLPIAINLVVFGILMWICDFFRKKNFPEMMKNSFRPGRAVMIGIFQALAVFPGVSRSGITITISRLMGLSRVESSRYSFILSLPLIWAGFFYKLPEIVGEKLVFSFPVCMLGIFISFVVGLFAIHFFMGIISRIGLGVFAVYRIILAVVLYFIFL